MRYMVLLAVVAVISLLSIMFAANNENSGVSSTVTVNAFIDTTINITAISFGTVDPNTTLNPANSSVNLTNTANSNSVIDVYLNNTNMTSGGDTILYNYTSVNIANNNSTITRLNGSTYINGTSVNTGFVENLGISTSQILYFWQDVPNAQAPGVYTQTINIRSMQGGIAPV